MNAFIPTFDKEMKFCMKEERGSVMDICHFIRSAPEISWPVGQVTLITQ